MSIYENVAYGIRIGEEKCDRAEIVTYNMQQAAGISDYTAFFPTDKSRIGRLAEFGTTEQIFLKPMAQPTNEYVSGCFG